MEKKKIRKGKFTQTSAVLWGKVGADCDVSTDSGQDGGGGEGVCEG